MTVEPRDGLNHRRLQSKHRHIIRYGGKVCIVSEAGERRLGRSFHPVIAAKLAVSYLISP
ncbi:MAG: hypothetical protein LUE92_13185 [Clostridiales bacterium]|nr:hypothetical protein [Clostridiales bacterium]